MPKPCNELKRAAEEINVDGTEDRYLIVPSPCKDEKRAAEEINVDGTEDK